MSSTVPESLFNARRWRLLACLFALCASVYMITYSARIESGDSLRLMDAVSSLVDHGDTLLDLSAWQYPPTSTGSVGFSVDNPLPLENVAVEPMQVWVAAPLYALAKALPEVGLLHAVWLTNVIISALTACLVCLFILNMGYGEKSAVGSALLLAFFTAQFPYTKSFFREPLMGLLIVLAMLSVDRLRRLHFRSLGWSLTAALSIVALVLTKSSALLVLPTLVILIAPDFRSINRRLLIALGVGLLIVAGIFIANSVFEIIPGLSARYSILDRLGRLSLENFPDAISAYLLSPGGSLWGTSPVVLFALVGIFVYFKKREFRLPLAVLTLVISFTVGYALLNGAYWFGGLSWPQRFLIPILPAIAVMFPAVVVRLLNRKPVWWIIAVPVIAYSAWVQWAAVSVPWGDYVALFPPEANGLLEWRGGLYDPAWFRWVLTPTLLETRPYDFAWRHIDQPIWPLTFAALAVLSAVAIIWLIRRPAGPRIIRLALPLAVLAWVLITWGYLRALYWTDTRYFATDETLHQALVVIEQETTHDDVILLSSPRYHPFFMNYGKWTDAARMISLRLQPGERPSPEQEPIVISDNPSALMHPETIPLITNLALTHDRLWMLVDGSPDLWWSIRPAERFMAAQYHPMRVFVTGNNTRVLEYSTAPAPDPFAQYTASNPTDLIFDEALELTGFELPEGSTFEAGEAVPVSLQWTLTEPLESNVTVAVFLRMPDGFEVTQNDWYPAGGFVRTSEWRVGAPIWDNRALRIPAGAPSGDYQLWVVVYDFGNDGARRDLPVTGSATIDGVIGVLPIRITVTPPIS